MEQHIGESVSVADVAAHCNLSESRLAHLFRAHLGQSVKTFQNALRVQQAKRLLATTQFSISRIGEHVGYSDAAPLKSNCRHASYNATAAALDKFRLRLPATIGSFNT